MTASSGRRCDPPRRGTSLHVCDQTGVQDEARGWAERFFALDGEPMRAKQRSFDLQHAWASETFNEARSCCLADTIEGGGYRSSCPFTSDEERERRLREYLATSS